MTRGSRAIRSPRCPRRLPTIEDCRDRQRGRVRLRALEMEAKGARDQLESYLQKYGEAAARDADSSAPADARIIATAEPPRTPTFPKVWQTILLATLAAFLARAGSPPRRRSPPTKLSPPQWPPGCRHRLRWPLKSPHLPRPAAARGRSSSIQIHRGLRLRRLRRSNRLTRR